MSGVIVTLDAREFPLEIAEAMLSLGKDLNMATGVTGYFEAHNRLLVYLESLTVYHKVCWTTSPEYTKQKNAVERYLTLHASNPNFIRSQARSLLDFMHYFPETPVAERPYEKVLDQDEYTGH